MRAVGQEGLGRVWPGARSVVPGRE